MEPHPSTRSASLRDALRLAFLVAAPCLAACSSAGGGETRAVGERFVAALGSDDRDELLDLLSPDVQWKTQGKDAREGRGAEGFADVVREFRRVFPDARIEPADVFSERGRVTVTGTLRGTQKGSWGVLHPQSEAVEAFCYLQLELAENGRVRALRWIYDGLDVLSQLGALDADMESLSEGWFAGSAASRRDNPDWFNAAIDMAGPTRVLTLDPYSKTDGTRKHDRDPTTGARRAFDGYQITGSALVESAELRRALSGLLYQGLYFAELPAQCFQPRHALEIEWQRQKLWIVLCFECGRGYVEREDGNTSNFRISDRPEPAFSEIYRSLGLTVAPKIG